LELGIFKKDHKRMTIDPKDICVMVSYNEGYSKMAEISVFQNMKEYCEIHGYTLHVDKQENVDNDRGPQWQKILVSLNLLKSNKFKWVFFIDTDCLFMNTTIKLETLIDDNYSFIVPSHYMKAIDTSVTNSQGTDCVITSQFFVKNDEFGISILEDIWSAKEWPSNMSINKFDYEQRQTRITIDKPEFKDKVNVIEEKRLNCFWYTNNPFAVVLNPRMNEECWKPGDFIVHVTGYPTNERTKLLSDLNYFRGGLLSKWKFDGDTSLKFSSLIKLDYVKISIFDKDHNIIINYSINSLNTELEYILYVDSSLKSKDLIIKGYDINDNLISIKYMNKEHE
jgi:hypothetical protein